MEKKPDNINEASGSSGPSGKPKLFTALCRDPKYRKANAEFLTRRLRLEFDKLTTTRPLCKAASREPLPPELQKCYQSNFRSNTKKSRKRSILFFIYRIFSLSSRDAISYFLFFSFLFSFYAIFLISFVRLFVCSFFLTKNFHPTQKCVQSGKNFAKHWCHSLWPRKRTTTIHFQMQKNVNFYVIIII